MGVDAEMFVRVSPFPSAKKIRRLSYELCSAFWPDKFMLDRKTGQHALEEYELVHGSKREKVVRVNLWSRYYGEGYERGDAPFLITLGAWLEKRFDGIVHYGGDSGDLEEFEVFDAKARAKLLAHFIEHGHAPYNAVFSNLDAKIGKKQLARHCAFCDEPMEQGGFGPQWALFCCTGCALEEETRDFGETWSERVTK